MCNQQSHASQTTLFSLTDMDHHREAISSRTAVDVTTRGIEEEPLAATTTGAAEDLAVTVIEVPGVGRLGREAAPLPGLTPLPKWIESGDLLFQLFSKKARFVVPPDLAADLPGSQTDSNNSRKFSRTSSVCIFWHHARSVNGQGLNNVWLWRV